MLATNRAESALRAKRRLIRNDRPAFGANGAAVERHTAAGAKTRVVSNCRLTARTCVQ